MDLIIIDNLPVKLDMDTLQTELAAIDLGVGISHVEAFESDPETFTLHASDGITPQQTADLIAAVESHAPAKSGKEKHAEKKAENDQYLNGAKIKDLESRIEALEAA